MSAASGTQSQDVDILHPFASLDWSECRHLPVFLTSQVRALLLDDKVYVGGSSPNKRNSARIYIYSPSADTWSVIDTPVYKFVLVAYNSQLLLVGGKEYVGERADRQFKNKILSMTVLKDNVGSFKEFLPRMPRIKYEGLAAVSHKNYLLVADGELGDVDVYDGHQWASAQQIPQEMTYSCMDSVVLDGQWYLCGKFVRQKIFYASLESLIATCKVGGMPQPSVWKRLSNASDSEIPGYNLSYSLTFFGRRLVAARKGTESISLYAYSSGSQLWTPVFQVLNSSHVTAQNNSCATVVLSSGELMILKHSTVKKAALKMTSFDPESLFTVKALHLLEASGIPLMGELDRYTEQIQNALNLTPESDNPNAVALLKCWLSDPKGISPTWKNFVRIIRQLGLEHLSQQTETYLSTPQVEQLPELGARDTDSAEGYVNVDAKDTAVFRLKQEIASLKEEREAAIFALEEKNMELKELKLENEHLKSQLLITPTKQEFKAEEQPYYASAPIPLKMEREEKLPALISVKTEREEKPLALAPMTSGQVIQPTDAAWDLPGIDVCREMTVVVYSSRSQQITLEDYGLKLYVQEGSLPAGMKQCTIDIKVSLAGQYEFPDNSHLVSAIFWFRCKAVSRFSRPITVEIQHCAMSDRAYPLHLNFVRAVCRQKHLPYTFQLLGGDFTSYSSYGVIEVYSFSGLGVVQEGSDSREYYSQLFYLDDQLNKSIKIHFVVIWNTEAHRTVVREEYKRKGAIHGPYQLVEFESEEITLDIPPEGTSSNGWKIIPLVPPVLKKTQVDNFKEGKFTPCCQLKAELSTRRKKIPGLNYRVLLQGAKGGNKFFIFELPIHVEAHAGPPPPKRQRSRGETPERSTHQGLDTKLGFELHNEVCDILKVLDEDQILSVGGALGLAYFILKKMKTLPGDMVAAWFRKQDFVKKDPTWRILAEALKQVGQTGVAEKIEQEKNS